MSQNRILIVEDDLIIAEDTRRILLNFGYEVTSIVPSGKEALSQIKGDMPDLVIMDIKLRGKMDGTELADRIRTEYDLPVIYVTAYADEQTLQKIKQTEPYGFIVKPYESKELQGVIENALYKHEMEQKLRESEERYRMLVETMNDGLGIQDEQGIITYANARLCEMWGYPQDEIIGSPVTHFLDEQNMRVFNIQMFSRKNGSGDIYEIEWTRKDGNKIVTLVSPKPITDAEGNFKGSFAVITDITEKKKAHELVEKSLREKELLLKEIHHRVKNNLQIINSLLNLQAQQLNDPATLEMFRQSQNRVRSMALLHEHLYRSKDLEKIDFDVYIRELANNLYQAYDIDPGKISIEFRSEKVSLGIDLAVPCGLAINELLSNALKYAFPSSFKGKCKIEVLLRQSADGIIELVVGDNGIGLPEGFDIHKAKTLGLRLIHLIAEDQLQGEIYIEKEKGARFFIKFKG